MHSLTPHQKQALEYKHHISLSANAGSGKTYVLTKRYLQIIENEDINLREIAAITFTDKAASELYKKITSAVEGLLNSKLSKKNYEKWNRIRRELVSAHISTIHSFCVDILKQFPVEANIDANFTPIDTINSDELVELSIEDEIKKSFNDKTKSDEIKKIIRIVGSKLNLSKILTEIVKDRRKLPFIKELLGKNNTDDTIKNYSDKYEMYLEEMFTKDIPLIKEKIETINEIVLSQKNDNVFGIEIKNILTKIKSDRSVKENLIKLKQLEEYLLTNDYTVKKRGYSQKILTDENDEDISFIEEFYNKLKNLNFEIDEENINKKLANFTTSIISISQNCIDNYEQRKSENGLLDYEDILLHTKKIISNPNVLDELSKKFKYIMIDEYQDTNELQYNIFLPILDYLKKGNLFIVGDEKQSIYRFRDADLNIFNKTKENIKEHEGIDFLLSLPDSFRMSPVIAAFTNYIFKNIFADPNPLYNEVEYSELICANDDKIEGKIELLISEKTEDDLLESDLVARRILKLINQDKWDIKEKDEKRNLQWRDISILCRKRKYFKELENSFIKYKIPYTIVGGQGFYQKQLIYDVNNYFSFLLNNKNDTALIGILRSPFFNLSDADLFEISLETGDYYWEKLNNYSIKYNKVKTAVEQLKENLKLASSSEYSFVLRKIISETPFISTLASRINGRQEIANLNKLISITNNYSQNPFSTLYDYVEFLSSAINKISDEAQSNLSVESSAVKIMTLHQAKGLEYPVVFLYKCGEKEKSRSKNIIVDREFGILTKLPSDDGYFNEFTEPPLLSIYNIIDDKKELAEMKRLLYVGLTRAKNYLFISATKSKKYDNSFLGTLLSSLNYDEDKNEINISTKLNYLVTERDNYQNKIQDIQFNIPIINSIEVLSEFEGTNIEKNDSDKEINLQAIIDNQSEEIISATKIAVYSQCPQKYNFTYDLGLTNLYENYKNAISEKSVNKEFEFTSKELTEDNNNDITTNKTLPADLKGKIIHRILQENIELSRLEDLLNKIINESNINNRSKKDFVDDIKNDLSNFYSSKIYTEINSYSNYKNEFEVYLKENDYYLFGIIDKIIFDENSITIIDYKTDNISTEQINDRIENYLPQLIFYSYIIMKLFTSVKNINIKLIFIKHPDNLFSKSITNKELNSFGSYLKEAVKNMRIHNYNKNLKHCSKCLFTDLNGNCIKK